jgi:hypothetical protein
MSLNLLEVCGSMETDLLGLGQQALEMEFPAPVHPNEILKQQKNIVVGGTNKVGKSTFLAALRLKYIQQGRTVLDLVDMKYESLWNVLLNPRLVVFHYPDWGEFELSPRGSPQYYALGFRNGVENQRMREEDYEMAKQCLQNLHSESHSSVQDLISKLQSNKINIISDIEFLRLREALGGGQKDDVRNFLQEFFNGLFKTKRGVKYASVFYDEAQAELPSKKAVAREGQLQTANLVGSSFGRFASFFGNIVISTFNLTELARPIINITHYWCLFQIPMEAAMGELDNLYPAVHMLQPHTFTLARNDGKYTPHVSVDPDMEDDYPDLVHFDALKFPAFWVQPFPLMPSIPEAKAQDDIAMASIHAMRRASATWDDIRDELNEGLTKEVNLSTLKSQYYRWLKARPVTPQPELETQEVPSSPQQIGDQGDIQGEVGEEPEA